MFYNVFRNMEQFLMYFDLKKKDPWADFIEPVFIDSF